MIYVGSLKYSPVFKSHCCAFGKTCEESGFSVRYLFSREYEWMLPPSIKEKTVFVGHSTSIFSMLKDSLNLENFAIIRKAFSNDKPTHVYLHNYHLLNHFIAKECRRIGGKFIYHVHEPHIENKRAHGGFMQYWLYLNEFMDARLLRNTSVAIVSSKEGSRLFNSAFPNFQGKKLEIPLQYEDEGNNVGSSNERKYITFVGPPVPAKSPEIFLKIVDYAGKHNPDWSFLMISREKISDKKFLNKSNLRIYQKEHISDEEYGTMIQQSFAVLTPYKRETQSSVILVSYMHGTPVVSSNIGGLPEFVKCGSTGYLVDLNAPIEEWIEALKLVRNNFKGLTVQCRKYFEEKSCEKNWKKYLESILA